MPLNTITELLNIPNHQVAKLINCSKDRLELLLKPTDMVLQKEVSSHWILNSCTPFRMIVLIFIFCLIVMSYYSKLRNLQICRFRRFQRSGEEGEGFGR